MSTQSKLSFWRKHIENYSRSPLNQKQYCTSNCLALSTFGYWKKKLKAGKQQPVRFYPLTVQPETMRIKSSRPAGLSIHVTQDELRVELTEDFSAEALKKLLINLKQL
jgi:hypothetical protein